MTRDQGLEGLWPEGAPIIGMVHLLPLPGSPGWGGSMDEVVERARADAAALEAGGADGVLVENFLDTPFFGGRVPPETVAAMTRAVEAVRGVTELPCGVNVLRNDAHAALAIAVATGARFIRVNVHTGAMESDQGRLEGRAAHTLRTRRALEADVAILADVWVKHAAPPPGSSLEDAARDTWTRGRADALIVSGRGTGFATDPERIERVAGAVPEAPVLVGSGATPRTAATLLAAADGLIVGTAFARNGRAGAGVDESRVRALVEAARTAR